MKMMKTWPACAFAGLAATLAATSRAPAATQYELIIIEPWNTSYSLATSSASGLNNDNVVSGCASPISGNCSFLWTLEGGKQQVNLGGIINDNGVVVGGSWLRWPDGTLQQLQNAAGYTVGGADINNSNVVAGAWGNMACQSQSEAATWHPTDGITLYFQDLGIFAADQLRAINEHNRVVGMISTTGQCGDFKAFYYDMQSEQFINLHLLLTGSSSGLTQAFDINDSDLVLGEGPHEGTVRPFLWSQASGFTFPPAPAGAPLMNTHLTSLNNHEVAVGWANVSGQGTRGIIWDDANGTRDLNDLLVSPAPPGFSIDGGKKINDNGWIIGSGHYGTWSPTRAVVLIPVPEAVAGDITGDGSVDVADLLMVINAWGACPAPPAACAADVTGDGQVDVQDLLKVISNWSS